MQFFPDFCHCAVNPPVNLVYFCAKFTKMVDILDKRRYNFSSDTHESEDNLWLGSSFHWY